MNELWKDMQGYEGLYQVSNMGNIKNSKGHIMKHKPSKDGYVRILLYKNRHYKSLYVHILVAKAFIPNPECKSEVNHIDGNKSNNCASNLEWVTRQENHFHAVKMNLKKVCPTIGKFGAHHPASKPIYQYSENGCFIKKWDCREDAAAYYGCTVNSITRCISGLR